MASELYVWPKDYLGSREKRQYVLILYFTYNLLHQFLDPTPPVCATNAEYNDTTCKRLSGMIYDAHNSWSILLEVKHST